MPIDYSNKFVKLREKFRLTQSGLADKLGVPRGRISQIETGNQKPTLEILQAVINNLDISSDYFFNENNYDLSNLSVDKVNNSNNLRYSNDSISALHKPKVNYLTEKEKRFLIQEITSEIVIHDKINSLNSKIKDLEELIKAKDEIIRLHKSQSKSI